MFFDSEDRQRYLEFVREAAERFGVLTDLVHFVAAPKGEKSLGLCFGNAHTQFTRMTHFRKGWCGHRWRVRFGSWPMDGRKV